MYKVYCDSYLLYHSKLENLKIFDASIELELNKTGSFLFTVYPDHPHYARINKLKSIITVYQDDYLLFRGRVLNDTIGFYNEKHIECEGELSFFLDSIQRPYEFTGSIPDYLTLLLTSHNSQVEAEKQFTLGTVTVTDPNDYIIRSNIDYVGTLDELNKKLLDLLGGYLYIRHENGIAYLDYLQDFSLLSSQTIKFGTNLLDLKRVRKGENIATALIPLGAKLKDAEGHDTDVRLTISSVNSGLDYIADQNAVNQYGFICVTNTWDDVTEASNLLTKAQAYLSGLVNLPESVELTAADMATVDANFSSFHLGTYVRVSSEPHGIEQNFLVSKLSINLLDPASNKLTLGAVNLAFSEAVKGISDGQSIILQEIEKSGRTQSEAILMIEQNFESSIQQSEQNIQMSVAENFYLKDQTDALISSVSTEITQTKNSVEIQFNQFNADLQAVASGTDSEFEEIKKYIRFVDGKILLGAVGNELELQIANDRISFIQDGAEVAYFSDRKLYVTDAEFINSLKVGRFAFMPRANGNLSFKKVVN